MPAPAPPPRAPAAARAAAASIISRLSNKSTASAYACSSPSASAALTHCIGDSPAAGCGATDAATTFASPP
eukprot:108347-Chlamydomonas_euryale.AAC.13